MGMAATSAHCIEGEYTPPMRGAGDPRLNFGIGLAVIAMAWVPGTAKACPAIPCGGSGHISEIAPMHTVVARDGALVFRIRRNATAASEISSSHLEITVHNGEGEPLDGQLEPDEGRPASNSRESVFVWRPLSMFVGQDVLDVHAAVDNTDLAPAECGESFEETFSFAVSDVSGAALPPPQVQLVQDYRVAPTPAFLSNLVCCDGAYPTADIEECLQPPVDVELRPNEKCVPLIGEGRATGTFTIHGTSDLALSASLRFDLLLDGEVAHSTFPNESGDASLSVTLDRIAITTVRMVHLIHGTLWESEPWTIDGGHPDALGDSVPPISSRLATICEGTPYVCGTTQHTPLYGGSTEQWDPDDCEPFDMGAEVEVEVGGETSSALPPAPAPSTASDSGGASEDALASDEGFSQGTCACTVGQSREPIAGFMHVLVLLGLGCTGRRRRPEALRTF